MPRVAEFRLREFDQKSITNFTEALLEVSTAALQTYGNAKVFFEPDPIGGMLLVVVSDASEKTSTPEEGFKLEERYLKAYHAQLNEEDRRYVAAVYPHKNWAQLVPQCTQCSGVAAADQDGIVHHKGHRQKPYGMLCGFHGSNPGWLDYVASITPCPVCKEVPKLMRPNVISHLYTGCGPLSGEFSSRGWLRQVEEFSEVAPPTKVKKEKDQ